LSKPIIDQLDGVLAEHYRLSREETDLVVNYDVKYRGLGGDDGEEE